jgi:hypothetical protein
MCESCFSQLSASLDLLATRATANDLFRTLGFCFRQSQIHKDRADALPLLLLCRSSISWTGVLATVPSPRSLVTLCLAAVRGSVMVRGKCSFDDTPSGHLACRGLVVACQIVLLVSLTVLALVLAAPLFVPSGVVDSNRVSSHAPDLATRASRWSTCGLWPWLQIKLGGCL